MRLCRNQHKPGSSRNALRVLYFSGSCVFQIGSNASSGVAGPTRTPSASTSTAPGTVSRNAGMPDSALAPAPVKNTTRETEGLARRRAARSTDAAAAPERHSAETSVSASKGTRKRRDGAKGFPYPSVSVAAAAPADGGARRPPSSAPSLSRAVDRRPRRLPEKHETRGTTRNTAGEDLISGSSPNRRRNRPRARSAPRPRRALHRTVREARRQPPGAETEAGHFVL